MTEREKEMREAIVELGKWLARLSHDGRGNHQIANALERARGILRRIK